MAPPVQCCIRQYSNNKEYSLPYLYIRIIRYISSYIYIVYKREREILHEKIKGHEKEGSIGDTEMVIYLSQKNNFRIFQRLQRRLCWCREGSLDKSGPGSQLRSFPGAAICTNHFHLDPAFKGRLTPLRAYGFTLQTSAVKTGKAKISKNQGPSLHRQRAKVVLFAALEYSHEKLFFYYRLPSLQGLM